MKKIQWTILLLSALAMTLFANSLQDAGNSATNSSFKGRAKGPDLSVAEAALRKKEKKEKSPHAFKAYVGYRPLEVDANNYFFTFIDSSPVPDTITDFGSFDKPGAFAFGFGVESNTSQRVHREYEMEFQIGTYRLIAAQVGIGYNQNIGNLISIRPKATAGFGSGILPVGRIVKGPGSSYIQFTPDGKTYFGDMEAEIKQLMFITTPSLDIVVKPSEKWYLTLSGGYVMSWNPKDPYYEFTSVENDEGSVELDMPDESITFNIDGREVDQLPFGSEGLSFTIAVSYNFLKRLNY